MNYEHELDRDEGFTGAFKRTPWEPAFAWLPTRLTEYPRQKVWLRRIEIKRYGAFGIPQFAARLPALAAGAQSAETRETAAQSVRRQSGGEAVTPNTPTQGHPNGR